MGKQMGKTFSHCLTFAMSCRTLANNTDKIDRGEDGLSQADTSGLARIMRVQQSQKNYLSMMTKTHYVNMISKFKTIFEQHMLGFLRQIQSESSNRYEHYLSNLASRLDYNDYYSSVGASIL